ncbi:MAG: FAD-dependent thymidylate synthase [Methylophagaceae bacterium]|jgi:thymidylate synthase (FAD)|tara:strand:+ start:81 stop:761 length:681 start_codon:yes stop_codon:yes gene_type:complete
MTSVKLVSYSQPTQEFIDDGVDNVQELIAFCAKVSNPSAQINNETSERLIKYLIKHQHWSPLEMANAVLEIDTTRDIAHQVVRHRSFAFQEFSQRYANPKEMGEMFVTRECRLQDTKNRQNSVELDLDNLEHTAIADRWLQEQQDVIWKAQQAYNWAIEAGIAKEQARCVLPEGLTKTRLYMNGTLRSWVHYIELRGANGTQKEHMDIAHACAKVISEIFPLMKDL